VISQHAQCLGGIGRLRNRRVMEWYDGAEEWLWGRQDLDKVIYSKRKHCENGVLYNEMLPDESSEANVYI